MPLDLQAAFDLVYRRGGYELQFDYADDPPPPPMSPDTFAWCRARIVARQSASSG